MITGRRCGVVAFRVLVALLVAVVGSAKPQAARAGALELAALGKKIFFDPALSASGRMSCATCHNPQHAYGPPNGQAVQLGRASP